MGIFGVFGRNGSNWRLKALAIWNLIAFSYFCTLTSVTTYLVLFEMIPFIFGEFATSVMKHDIFTCFILLQVVGNVVLVITTDSSIHNLPPLWNKPEIRNISSRKRKTTDEQKKNLVKISNQSVTRRKDADKNVNSSSAGTPEMDAKSPLHSETEEINTTVCDSCNALAPKRSHHCLLCNECILKRDHHCFFMCTCIGFYNQKYFILWCFYMFIGSFYSLVIIAMYLKKYFNISFGMFSLLTLLPNTLYGWWFESSVIPYQLLIVGVFYACLTCGLAAAGFFYWQLYIVLQGQTTYEAWKGILTYSNSEMLCNFKDVFGPFWYISIFLPLPLPQKGLGVY
ncbi:palmitoyltransferase PFA3-like [Lingula anatina]|uniref:Palmitoyltransferase n=1 Tax=Lingula anatina TaxID=7574 RepID=A0A1S3IBU5_LINAN|nr:palmitoyltransferase PFA3-like [Lingula anatina]|eukprot:XP_013395643.1 palmitoyltransferase PFA3-like [Lingula anatina]